jgi:hypothetical protein
MFDWLRYQYQLSRLQKEGRALKKTLEHAAKQQISEHEVDQLLLSMRDDLQIHYEKTGILQTQYLTSLAEKLLIPVPQGSLPLDERGNDKWSTTRHGGFIYLNSDGIRELRVAIRADRRERLELIRSWLTGLTGLIGAIIGLLAIILKR